MSNENEPSEINDPMAEHIKNERDPFEPKQWELEYFGETPEGLKEMLERKQQAREQYKANLAETNEDLEFSKKGNENIQAKDFARSLAKNINEVFHQESAVSIEDILRAIDPKELSDEELGLECNIVDNIKAYVQAKDASVPSILVAHVKERPVHYKRDFFKHGNSEPDQDLAFKTMEELIAFRQTKMPEVEERRRKENEERERRNRESFQRQKTKLAAILKKMTHSVEFVQLPDNSTALEIKGEDNLKNLQLKDAQPGDVFGFELVCVGENKLSFKLVKISGK